MPLPVGLLALLTAVRNVLAVRTLHELPAILLLVRATPATETIGEHTTVWLNSLRASGRDPAEGSRGVDQHAAWEDLVGLGAGKFRELVFGAVVLVALDRIVQSHVDLLDCITHEPDGSDVAAEVVEEGLR